MGEKTSAPAQKQVKAVIAGGGPLPPSVHRSFIDAAGGPSARIFVIPSASGMADSLPLDEETANVSEFWSGPKEEVAQARLIHAFTREEADDADWANQFNSATGVWLGGGRQTELIARYRGTKTEHKLRQLFLEKGIPIGGTSAGAAAFSPLMIAGGKTQAVVSEGLELLPTAYRDITFDQHFTQRGRGERLENLVKSLFQANIPSRGIGIDEGTAVVIDGDEATVVGNADVHIYNPTKQKPLSAGARFDLRTLLEIKTTPTDVTSTAGM